MSGGQTGVDRAALDWALWRGIECGGWCPMGRKAEDGLIPSKYPLVETPCANYIQRTEWNVRDTGGTVIISIGRILSGGSKKTLEFAQKKTASRACIFDARSAKDWAAENVLFRYLSSRFAACLAECGDISGFGRPSAAFLLGLRLLGQPFFLLRPHTVQPLLSLKPSLIAVANRWQSPSKLVSVIRRAFRRTSDLPLPMVGTFATKNWGCE